MKINSKKNHYSKYENAHLVNSLTGFKSAHLMGTRSKDGHQNCTLLSSVVHCGSDPACVGIVFRPHTVPRHGLENILETKIFTLNAITKSMVKQAHQTSAAYPRDHSEFDTVGFDTTYIDQFNAPYVQQSPLKMGCRFVEKHDIQFNGTHFILAEIESLYIPEDSLSTDGFIDCTALDIVTISGLNGYGDVSLLYRLDYPASI